MQKSLHKRISATFLVFAMFLASLALSPDHFLQAEAVSADYAAQLVRISTNDNSRNLNLSGTADNAPCNTWDTNGVQNENWRLDFVGANSTGSFFKIVNMGTGRLLTPLGNKTDANTACVIYGSESASAQHWYIIPVSQDSKGDNLAYKIVNYDNTGMALTYNSAANTVTLTAYSGAENQKWLLNTAGLQGFGGYCKDMNGKAKASTIGGLLGATVEVTTFDELKAACTDTAAKTIVITKDISGKTGSANYEISTGYDGGKRYYCRDNYIYLQPNKTIIGSYGAHTLHNVYFRTYNESYGPGHNIILRNITCTHDTELNTDNIWEFAFGWNFWVDHCDLVGHNKIETSTLGSDDWDKFLNFKGNSDFISISDCTVGHHEYGVLLGYPTDTQETYDTYNGTPCVTLADNYYNNCITRAPGLMRYGYFHSFNNYVINFDMGYTIYTAAKLYAEGCYYDAGSGKGSVVNDTTSTSDISSKYPGKYTETGSTLVNSRYTLTGKNAGACTWRPTSNYTYTAKTAADAKTYCTTYSGAQSSSSKMTYAAFAAAGVPSAAYVSEPSEPVVIEPLSGKLISNLLVEDTANAQSWSIQSHVQVGSLLYGDRDVTYATLPAALLGAEVIRTACDGKSCTGTQATFTAAESITVYIALDSRVTAVPAWMSGFTKTAMTATNNKDVTFILYSKQCAKGTSVTLGTNGQTANCVNYTVLAVRAVGDINADGQCNTTDAVMLLKYLVRSGSVTNAAAADLSSDGVINALDLLLLKQRLCASVTPTETPVDPPVEEPNLYEGANFSFSGKVYLVGDSTVCTYDSNTNTTYNRYGWGMKLAEQYSGVTVNNLALSGRSSRSFLSESNYTTLANSLSKGDYLFIQFGHNDEKTDETTYPGLGTYPGLDFSTLDSNGKNSSGQYSYEWILLNKYVKLAQSKGAVPVLITPITRRGSDGTANYAQHTSYQQAILKLAQDNSLAVIDMTALTTSLYTNLYNSGGAAETAKLHCYSDTAKTTIDNTHLSNAGATKIASMIAEQTQKLGLTIGELKK